MIEQDKRIFNGVDVKRFQYEEYATNLSDKLINLQKLINENLFQNKDLDMNCILINIEKDYKRYESSVEELKKIGVFNFSHLKATYWKDKQKLSDDLTFVLQFLKNFNQDIKTNQITIDDFSFLNDENILIQDGPLACYVSHLRAMIYGYTNFKDYTIIVEDDISIANTENIEKYISEVPDDWDILMFNACSKNKIYDKTFYKFSDEFHSTHFYIINHKCLPYLFQNLYPITDQVDVLISNLHKNLNIYNIQETVYQKNISTNTQNNLYVIFNSKHYDQIRERIKSIEENLTYFTNKILPNNEKRNDIIVLDLMYDVLYEYLLYHDPTKPVKYDENKDDFDLDINGYIDFNQYINMLESMRFFLQCSKKGIKGETEAKNIIKVFLYTLHKFSLHNKLDTEFNEVMKAYGFGSTSHTYLLPNSKIIIKKLNDKLRWTSEGHNNSNEIFDREVILLKKLGQLISFDKENKIIKMPYLGESLYDNFYLPNDWKEQIKDIFKNLDSMNIFYPEFRLQNILVLDDKISFIDYGLATFDSVYNNENNLKRFIKDLDLINDKLSGIFDRNSRLQIITTFFRNQNLEM